MGEFEVTNEFLDDGKPVQILSGAIHYFRIVPEYWLDRLQKLKACGFNTVETYIAWNLHEPKEGEFCFEGLADVVRFIETADELGLYVIVRPSPYICAEWEFGGLPAWLLADPEMRLRCYHRPFLDKVDAYYDVLLPKLLPLLRTNGGPIIAVQIENEYGSYGNDVKYLQYLQSSLVERGVDVPLFTSDGPEDWMLQGGMVPGVLETVNFGSRTEEAFAKLQEYQSEKPSMCMEFWIGWFDHWGEKHHVRDAQEIADEFERMLQLKASVNFYMFHGGTNFGFYNGANYGDHYEPTVTSYDYGALLNEAGEPTPQFYAIRNVMEKYKDIGACSLPEPVQKRGYGSVRMTERISLFDSLHVLAEPVRRNYPETMEKLGQGYGFILYSTQVSGPRKETQLHLKDVHDRALVFLNDSYVGTVERWNPQPLTLTIPPEGAKLDILVENMGRINYGPHLKDMKGITEGVLLDRQFLFDWTMYPLPLDSLDALAYQPFSATSVQEGPAFYRGNFQADAIADTFVRLDGWTKGVVYINGFNLGRYWEVGPQHTLYVPGPLLREGSNEIVIFELHGTVSNEVRLVDTSDLGESDN